MKTTQRRANDGESWLAHRIIFNGELFTLSIAAIKLCGAEWKVTVEKFTHEVHSTAFHNGTIRIDTKQPGARPVLSFE